MKLKGDCEEGSFKGWRRESMEYKSRKQKWRLFEEGREPARRGRK